MKGIKRFEIEIRDSDLKELGIPKALFEGEHVLGLYRTKTLGDSFVVTDRSLILSKHGLAVRVGYDQMLSSIISGTDKSEASEVQIKLNNGNIEKVIVDGGDGKFRDVFSFGRFISRVIEDQKK